MLVVYCDLDFQGRLDTDVGINDSTVDLEV